MDVLDVGTGTGLLAREIVHVIGPAGRVVGVDPAFNMMAAGRDISTSPFVQGVGERLPFPDRRFDFMTMGYALRHVPDLDQAFEEYRRVLKPGGRVLLLEITQARSVIGMALARVYFGRSCRCHAGGDEQRGRCATDAVLLGDDRAVRAARHRDGVLRRSGFDGLSARGPRHFQRYTAIRSR